jgi:2'-hydroxyisoflavone reductase
MKRRQFVKNASASAVLAGVVNQPARAQTKPLQILIMGGTGFVGPHTVNAALAQGHKVTLFNRGKTNPGLFSELETIVGDRNTDQIEKLADRKWDAVIDTSAYYPRSVNSLLDVVKNNIQQYLFVSSISVYQDWSKVGMDETAPLATMDDPTIEEVTGETYGPLKVLCEQAANNQMPDRTILIRPGLIVGPRDKTDRFTYWPVRIKRGGTVLAPSDGSDYIQYIDVRDLADWMVHCLQQHLTGAYNAITSAGDITIKKLLETCVSELNPQTKLEWVNADFLEKHDVRPWQEMTVWIPTRGDYAAAGSMSAKKAYANGLKERSMTDVINDCYNWFVSLPDERQAKLRAGINSAKEETVLAAWREHNA